MIRAVAMSNSGPIVLFGVTEDNVRRLKAGRPIDVDLRALMHASVGDVMPSRIVISYGARHVDVVGDMERGGLPVPPALHEQARELDAQLDAEGET
jgi:hypothetical protein